LHQFCIADDPGRSRRWIAVGLIHTLFNQWVAWHAEHEAHRQRANRNTRAMPAPDPSACWIALQLYDRYYGPAQKAPVTQEAANPVHHHFQDVVGACFFLGFKAEHNHQMLYVRPGARSGSHPYCSAPEMLRLLDVCAPRAMGLVWSLKALQTLETAVLKHVDYRVPSHTPYFWLDRLVMVANLNSST
jgi:hypothetical protein